MRNIVKKYHFPIILILIGVFFLYKSPTDPDYGWHFKYGEYFFNNHKLLTENIYSFVYPDYKWVNSYWLFETLLFFFNKYLGHVIITTVLSLITAIVFYSIIRRISKTKASFILSYFLVLASISGYFITVRPHFYSSVLMAFLLYTLLYKQKYKKFLPLIFLFWANTHAEFVIALFVLGLYSLNNLFFDYKQQSEHRVRIFLSLILKHFSLLTACFLVTFINPNGVNLWLTLIKELTLPVKSYVVEWDVLRTSGIDSILSAGMIFAVYLLGGLNYKYNNNYWYRFLLVFLFIFSIKAAYMGRVFFIVGTFGLIGSTDILVQNFEKFFADKYKRLMKISFYSSLYFVFLISLINFVMTVKTSMSVKGWSDQANYPYDAVEYIKTANLPGNMFNNYNWGGYLIWQLPEYKTFVDGRMTSWREGDHYIMEDYTHMLHEPEKYKELFEEYVDKYNIGWVLDTNDIKLIQMLDKESWEKVYEDRVAVIYRRNN